MKPAFKSMLKPIISKYAEMAAEAKKEEQDEPVIEINNQDTTQSFHSNNNNNNYMDSTPIKKQPS